MCKDSFQSPRPVLRRGGLVSPNRSPSPRKPPRMHPNQHNQNHNNNHNHNHTHTHNPHHDMHAILPKFRRGYERPLSEAFLIISTLSSITQRNFDEKERASIESHLISLMDEAVGIICPHNSSTPPLGITLSSHLGCKSLPLGIVRGVEYEALARVENWSEMDISAMHSLLTNINGTGHWFVGDVTDISCAKDYLTRATLSYNRFARRALAWLTPERTGRTTAALQSPVAAREAFVQAIQKRQRDRAVQLGRLMLAEDESKKIIPKRYTRRSEGSYAMGGGRFKNAVDNGYNEIDEKEVEEEEETSAGSHETEELTNLTDETPEFYRVTDISASVKVSVKPDATVVLGMKPREQKAMSANNLGFLLQHGNKELNITKDLREAILYYEMAVAWGSAAAASNLAYLHHSQNSGIKAYALYNLAIERGERNFAPRNLALLLLNGSTDLKADPVNAAQFLLLGIQTGDAQARVKCRRTLAKVLKSFRFKLHANSDLRRQCAVAVTGKSKLPKGRNSNEKENGPGNRIEQRRNFGRISGGIAARRKRFTA